MIAISTRTIPMTRTPDQSLQPAAAVTTPQVQTLFRNRFPGDPVGAPIQEITATQACRPTFTRRLNYVVMENGTLRLGRIKKNVIGGGHIDLTGGAPVRAAGKVKIVRGSIQWLNNDSGHYQPSGAAARAAAERAFEAAGFEVAGKYVEVPF